MRVSLCRWLGLLALGTVMAACGDKTTNPDAVTVDKLKGPGKLAIRDDGDGTVVLSWSGANNEDDFDGYNVYGVKGMPKSEGGTLDVERHKAIELLDDKGEKSTAAEATLGQFNYAPATGLELAAPPALQLAGETPEFSALPIHTLDADGTTKLLPTCKAKDGECTMTTAANKDTTAKDPNYAVNGRVEFTVPKTLLVGETYCFFVMSSMNNGEKVSQTSTNVECVTPRYKLDLSLTMPTTNTAAKLFDLRAILATCTTTCDATAAATKITTTTDGGAHNASDTGPVYIEFASNTTGFVPTNGVAINDLGYYADGFEDATLPKEAPTLVLGTTPIGGSGDNSTAPSFNGGGYSLAGQTVPLVANHIYVFAVSPATATVPPTFNYHWLYVTAATTATASVKMRLTKVATK